MREQPEQSSSQRRRPFERRASVMALVLVTLMCAPRLVDAQMPEDGVIEVVDTYHRALASGDSVTALSLLAEDVTILESGGAEDKEQYRSGHLSGDMRFAAAVPRERGEIRVTVLGDVAWAWSTNTAQGRMGERDVNSRGAELMVLSRDGDRWMIRAIHWSSRSVR
ncbi:MAG: nuclear transport factor 2 family protein [Gemmatimonadota bacterium]|nr:nuclear transport factor 2 family protein [Gemmatimonadota bacterium]